MSTQVKPMKVSETQYMLLIKAVPLVGKVISVVKHHDSFPSLYFGGPIVGLRPKEYGQGEIELMIKDDETGINHLAVCNVVITKLLEEGKYYSAPQWSKETKSYSMM